MKRFALLLALLLPGCAVYPAGPYYGGPVYRPAPPVVAYGYGYRPYGYGYRPYGYGGYHRGGWGRRW